MKQILLKNHVLTALLLITASPVWAVDANIQIFYDFGSDWKGNACENHRTERVTSTVELFHPDNWGSTYFFVDFDYSVSKKDPEQTPFGAYWEISRSFNFWKQSKVKDLSLHLEYDGGCGIYGNRKVEGGYSVKNTVLVGPEYFFHTQDFKNTFTLQFLYRYSTGVPKSTVPLQLTFVWGCQDFCTAKGLTFCGFFDLYGDRTYRHGLTFLTEPQLWYSIGQWFKCPNLCIGTEIEVSYNFTGEGWMANPCVGIRWNFL